MRVLLCELPTVSTLKGEIQGAGLCGEDVVLAQGDIAAMMRSCLLWFPSVVALAPTVKLSNGVEMPVLAFGANVSRAADLTR